MTEKLAHIESQPDPQEPARTRYRIRGAATASVQDAIDTIMRTVDAAFDGENGQAHFVGPIRVDGEWGAVGAVIIEAPKVLA